MTFSSGGYNFTKYPQNVARRAPSRRVQSERALWQHSPFRLMTHRALISRVTKTRGLGPTHKHLLLVYYFKVCIGAVGIQQISCGKFCRSCRNVTCTHVPLNTSVRARASWRSVPRRVNTMQGVVFMYIIAYFGRLLSGDSSCCLALLLQKLKSVFSIVRPAVSSVDGLAVVCEKHQVLPKATKT